ncbi:MAG: hypothetical protein R6X02_04355 [Enhygromyxa sp.]
MRFLLRLILSEPQLLFASLVSVAIALAVIGFVWSERRARALARLSEDPELASGQRRRLAIVALVTLAAIGLAAWWTFFRVHTEPQRVLIAIAIEAETEDGASQWWQGDRGALELNQALADNLAEVGLEPVPFDDQSTTALREADDLLLAARELEARWLIRGRITTQKVIELELADFSDFVLVLELELVDAETGELFAVPDSPLRVFLWGEYPSDALALNGRYLADRVTMPLIATLAAREPLREYNQDRAEMTTEQAMLAASLERLFLRADSYARGLELRARDEVSALAREPNNHAALAHARLSDILAEEYFIGTAFDGRALLLSDPKQVVVPPNQLGYSLTSESEALVLASLDGRERALLFEHYNFYSAPAISADGRVVWTTVANHGASKTLATIEVETGEFRPVLSHESDYYTNPIPAPDGARALFYSRPGRYAETSVELIERDGSGRKQVVAAGERTGLPGWAPDGQSIYIPVGAWQRIVVIDPQSGAQRHLLGQDPDAPPAPEHQAESPVDPPSDPPSDPRHLGLDDHLAARDASLAAADQPDPATTSRFSALSVGHDGRYLFVVEQSLDGREWLGRLDLDPAGDAQPDAYRRLAQMKVGRVLASPTGPIVALEAPSFTAPGDPDHSDREVLVFGPEPGRLRALTLNKIDDDLAGWSRDGRSVFTIQRGRDPGDGQRPVARIYRHDLD